MRAFRRLLWIPGVLSVALLALVPAAQGRGWSQISGGGGGSSRSGHQSDQDWRSSGGYTSKGHSYGYGQQPQTVIVNPSGTVIVNPSSQGSQDGASSGRHRR